MDGFGKYLLALLAVVFVVLLAGLVTLVTYNNGPVHMFGWKKIKYGNAIAFLFFVMMLGIAFLGWSKTFLLLNFGKA